MRDGRHPDRIEVGRSMLPKLSLPRVALCAVDTVNPELAARAIACCLDHCEFADAVLVTDRAVPAPCRVARIAPLPDRHGYSALVCKHLGAFARADFLLVVQWDGYVVDPASWRHEFLDYDYIGARWPWHDDGMAVGNGGFSLRSRKLVDALASPSLPPPGPVAEDVHIGRILRPRLEEDYGIRFAPDPLAEAFSYERSIPSRPSFGFHGLLNLWRHVEDAEMASLADRISGYALWTQEYAELIAQYAVLRKFGPLRALYGRLRRQRSADELLAHFVEMLKNSHIAGQTIEIGETAFR